MSAEILRKAAALMRERATSATNVTGASDWFSETRGMHFCGEFGVRSSGGFVAGDTSEEEAHYIASWNPDVALAVADWLDDIADRHQRTESYVVAVQALDSESDDESDFLRRVELGSASLGEGSWVETVIEDDEGNIVASTEPPEPCCTHRPQDGVWPCPEVIPALVVARAYLGDADD